ncbi:MAG: DNA photolyase [Spirochaetae bacterium HGW-Spirochaetae-1]|jgi:spore photoproduct lyase|nr:MAG: DNA photolyase [Spirochaetae bacterium HGW-Spirochaetae-1]
MEFTMVTIDGIKIIIYDKTEKETNIVRNFLGLTNRELFAYEDEDELGRIISHLKERGVKSKEVIILKKFLGRMYQKCPGSKNMICCNYRLLNTCFDCFYNCTYCFLNSYLNAYGITQFTNLENLADEIIAELDGSNDLVYRIGTGEFTDSLMMDEVTGIAAGLMKRLSRYDNVMLEFKTKSANIDHLLSVEEKGNAVLAWSLNTERNISLYEEGAATLDERIAAAEKARCAGYFCAFHFDPIIFYDGCMEEYGEVLDRLFSRIDPDGVVWISLGTFRHSPGFKEIIMDKFPHEQLTTGEMFPGTDGKMRYLKHKRIALYRYMKERIESWSGKPFVYLCMETGDIWESVFHVRYGNSEELERDFSRHLKENFLK